MAGVYSVEGKLGTGKSKFAIWRAQQALREGRRVAGNVDIFLEKISPKRRASYIRLPDKPTSFDLQAMGKGDDGPYDEDNFGVLILDELATWLNARSYQDKDRAGLLEWLVHARKLRWEVYFIVQDSGSIDKQIRTMLLQYTCVCQRWDKVRLPLVGGVIRDIGMSLVGSKKGKKWGCLPRLHSVAVRQGEGANKVVAERFWYRGDELHECYDTEQIFRSDYPHGAHSVLPPWDWQPAEGWFARLRRRLARAGAAAAACTPQAGAQALPPRVVQLLRQLPADEAMRHFRRLEAGGLL